MKNDANKNSQYNVMSTLTIVFVILIVVIFAAGCFSDLTKREKVHDVVLTDFSVANDGKVITIYTNTVSSNANLTEYHNFFAEETHAQCLGFYTKPLKMKTKETKSFDIELRDTDSKIYFFTNGGEQTLVLEKNVQGDWVRPVA